MNQKDIAIKYASNGISIFPCCPNNKSPLTKNGHVDATSDVSKVAKWWEKNPNALIGAPNGDILVIDYDTYKLNEPQMVLMAPILEELATDVLVDGQMVVQTKSGGQHYYFKNTNQIKRKIKNIAEIDVLGVGGYSILPDQKTYNANCLEPWEEISKECRLPEFNEEAYDAISVKYRSYTNAVKSLIKIEKGGKVQVSDGKKNSSGLTSDKEKYAEVEKDLRQKGVDDYAMGIVNYENDTVEFIVNNNVYDASTKEYEKADPNVDLFENGAIKLGKGEMTNERLMGIFYNKKTQMRLASFMNLPTPKGSQTASFHSIFPSHRDENKSMGIRWNNTGTHLLVRDFANHYTDVYNQSDYNLVRLYCVTQYNTNVPRLNGPEFTVWMMRMLVDAGMLDIDDLMVKLPDTDKLSKSQSLMLESFQLLDAIKSSYIGYSGTTTFADKFSSAWCGLTPSTANRTKKALVSRGHLQVVGDYDCSAGKRTDDFFVTKLYRMPIKNDKTKKRGESYMKFLEALNSTVHIPVERDKKKQVDNTYPDLGTVVALIVDEDVQQRIRNFAEDYNLDEVPSRDNMFVPLLVAEDYQPYEIDETKTYYMDHLQLTVEESLSDTGYVLSVTGISPPLEKRIEKYKENHNSLFDDDIGVGFVISSNFEPDEHNLNQMTVAFNEYLRGVVSLTEIDVRYMHDEEIVSLLDGKRPE